MASPFLNPSSNAYSSSCGSSWDNFPKPWDPCHCTDCKKPKRHSKKRCDSSSSDSDSEMICQKKRCDSSDDSERKCKKSCQKCRRSKCKCIKITPYLHVRRGYVSATLTKTANPTTYTSAGENILYSYTITNTGTAPICYPINICDDKLGGWLIPTSSILPGASQTFNRSYTTTTEDVAGGNIVNIASASIQVKPCKWVSTPAATATVTHLLN
jgi:hypothetical protein